MQGRSALFPRAQLFGVALLFCLITSARGAGIDFTLQFFKRATTTGGVVTTRAFNTVTGAIDTTRLFTGSRVIQTGIQGQSLTIERGQLLRIYSNGSFTNEPTNGLAINDWLMGLTYDTTRQRAVLVTLGGEGMLYQRAKTNAAWSVLASMKNEDVNSLVYHAAHDAFYAFRVYNSAPTGPTKLLKYSAAGVLEKEITLPPLPVNFGPGGLSCELVSRENVLILMVEPNSFTSLKLTDQSYIYVIDPDHGTMTLTFQGPSALPPTIRFVAPSAGATILPNQPTPVSVEVSDPNNDVRFVEVFEGSQSLKQWTFPSPGLNGTNRLTFTYLAPDNGTHTLSARAQDGQNLVANAPLLQINVAVPPPKLNFVVWFLDGNSITPVDYTEAGPVGGETLFRGIPTTQVGGHTYYGKSGHTIVKYDNERDILTTLLPSSTVPELSWPRGTAYDSNRNRIVVASLGGEGYLYAINPTSGAWSVISSMENVDVDSIVYYPPDDHYYAVENSGGSNLRIRRYTPSGSPDGTITVPNVPFQVGHYYQSTLAISSANNRIALLIEPMRGPTQTPPIESRIYSINPATGESVLTYKRVWDNWPPVVTPPPPSIGVKITSPTNSMQFPQGSLIRLVAQSTGPSNLASVVFLNGNVPFAAGVPQATIPPSFVFNWTNAPVGEIVLRAVGMSGRGQATSAPVTIRVLAPAPAVSARRDLPETYLPGFGLTVKIATVPNASVDAWALEERTPVGWQVSSISHEGVFDSVNQKIKWGPFTDRAGRLLMYIIRPPTNATSDAVFSGEVSVNGASSAITGDSIVRIVELFHPADIDPQDSKITIDELTAYASAWKTGSAWPRPPSPPILSYVTRAGYLWRNGESYRYQTNSQAPNWWAPLLPGKTNAPLARDAASGEVFRKLWPAFTPGRPVKVTLLARPTVGVSAYGVLEEIPAGWKIAEPGAASVVGSTLRFGPYFDAQDRTFVYTVTPPADAIEGEFGGEASFDGSQNTILGGGRLRRPAPAAERVDDHHVRLRFNATPGERFSVQTADAIDASAWTSIGVIEGAETPVELPLVETSDASRFYRLQPVED